MNADDSAQPPSLQGFPVILRLPIQWGDLDAYGHVNNVVYLKWFEAARAVYASRVGVEILSRERGVGATIASLTWNYHRQRSYPGDILCGVRVTRITIGSVRLQCHVADAQTGVPLGDGTCDAVLYDYASNEPVPVPEGIRAAIEELEGRSFPV